MLQLSDFIKVIISIRIGDIVVLPKFLTTYSPLKSSYPPAGPWPQVSLYIQVSSLESKLRSVLLHNLSVWIFRKPKPKAVEMIQLQKKSEFCGNWYGFPKAGCCLLKHQHQREGGCCPHLKVGANESLWFSASLIGAMSNTANNCNSWKIQSHK